LKLAITTSVVVIVVLQNFKLILSPIDHDLQHSIIVFNNINILSVFICSNARSFAEIQIKRDVIIAIIFGIAANRDD